MTAPWQAGTTYAPGALCIPTSSAPIVTPPLINPGFETGDLTGWAATSGTWAAVTTGGYSSGNCAQNTDAGNLDIATPFPTDAGQTITAQGFARITNAGTDNGYAVIGLVWYNSGGAAMAQTLGTFTNGKGGVWRPLSVTGSAPAGAAFVGIRLNSTAPTSGHTEWDAISWNYVQVARPPGLIFKATQAAPGKSGATEPAWPSTAGVSVTDNQVTWEGELGTRVVWQASPLMMSSGTEPTWPTQGGSAVHDGTIDWIAQSAQITDINCPQSKIVAIGAGKVFAADNDIVRYCATVNPTDWTSTNDAGYLPTGLQTYGSNPAAAMGLYRSNLVVYNAEGFQMWQLDPDPANIALLDALPVASTHNPALAPTANDLFFLSSQGVRSMGISSAGVNLEAGDVGMPVDALIKPALAAAMASGVEPIGTYVPAMGQYFLSFANYPGAGNSRVFVYSINVPNAPGKWSYYDFPMVVTDFTQLDEVLYIRGGDDVIYVDDTVLYDYVGRASGDGGQVDIVGVVQTPYLDLGSPGVEKMLVGFDSVNDGTPSVQIGYDEYNLAALTTGFTIPADTIPGMIIPLPIASPSFSLKLTYPAGAAWKMMSANFYTMRFRVGS